MVNRIPTLSERQRTRLELSRKVGKFLARLLLPRSDVVVLTRLVRYMLKRNLVPDETEQSREELVNIGVDCFVERRVLIDSQSRIGEELFDPTSDLFRAVR